MHVLYGKGMGYGGDSEGICLNNLTIKKRLQKTGIAFLHYILYGGQRRSFRVSFPDCRK